ncbi:MAG: hypothetical protein KC731_09480 [Myxococcales bacterium]|nr:hypothetical protein [Myxococcales bacterium]
MANRRALVLSLALSLLLVVSACGARSELEAPDTEDGGGDVAAGGGAAEERVCAPNCTIGHRCCQGGCSGPAAPTMNDCCTCLRGEVSSADCPSFRCGD